MKWIFIALSTCILASPVAAATLRKCVDEKGGTHYYDKNPPAACKDREITEMTTKGVVKKTISAPPTEEEIRAREEEAARKKEEEKRLAIQQRRDTALLQTYTTEQEIDLARDRNLQSTDASIKGIEPRLNSARVRLDQRRTQAAGLTKQGKPVPDWLSEELGASEKEVARLDAEMAAKRKERDEIQARFEADKQRFRELKSQAR